MSSRLTRLTLPNSCVCGYADWGVLSKEEIIKKFRDDIEYLRRQVKEADAASDDEFQIDVVDGPIAERHIRTVQESSRIVLDQQVK